MLICAVINLYGKVMDVKKIFRQYRFFPSLRVTKMKHKRKLMIFIIVFGLVILRKIFLKKNNESFPLIIWWTSRNIMKETTTVNCGEYNCIASSDRGLSLKLQRKVDAFLFYGTEFRINDAPLPRQPKATVWGLLHEESPRNNALFLSENILNLFNFSSTFSRYSNVPIPFHHLIKLSDITSTKYFVSNNVKDQLLQEIAPVLYIQTDCETSTERDEYVSELMKYINIDSYGKCLQNRFLPPNLQEDYLNNLFSAELLDFVSNYKFTIAIENGICYDYITEKLWRPIVVGSVPIYFGSPSIKDFLPNNKTAILLADYESPKRLAQHLHYLLQNTTAYEEHLEHKLHHKIENLNFVKSVYHMGMGYNFNDVLSDFESYVCCQIHQRSRNNIVTKKHYNCPKPVSSLTLQENKANVWWSVWTSAQRKGKVLYDAVISNKSREVLEYLESNTY